MKWIAPWLVFASWSCADRIDGDWHGRHESANEHGFTETLTLTDDARFTRNAEFTDALGCSRVEQSSGKYEFIAPAKVRFFITGGREQRACPARMDMNRPDMAKEGYDRQLASENIDCVPTDRRTVLFLDCGASRFTNRCYQRNTVPAQDCTPPAVP
jgi:hypothetical protein